MGKGLSIPVGVNQGGGAQLEDDPQHLRTILRLALSPGEDDNPFQNLGLDERIIFSINDPETRGVARNIIQKILQKFNDRLALDPATPIEFSVIEEGRLDISFRYVNLDTNQPTDFNFEVG